MRALVSWAVRNSPAMNTLMVAVLAVGVGSLLTLRRESFPEFQLEYITIAVPYPGASPSETETGICAKIEEAIRAIDGIKKVSSVAAENQGRVVAELYADVPDPQKILNEIRSEVDRIPSFPEDAEDPVVKQFTLRTTAILVAVIGRPEDDPDDPATEWQLREVAERVRDQLLLLPSVSQVDLYGEKDYQIDVELPEANLRKYGLTLGEVAEAIRRENIELPAGTLRTKATEFLVRGKNKHRVGTGIRDLPVLTQPNGVVLTVGDLGTVRDGFHDTDTINEIDGRPGLVLSVRKTATEDILRIVEEVRDYLASADIPQGYKLRAWGDESSMVRDRLELLARNGLSGLVLVFLVLGIFLEIRLAFWVALGIPISVLGTCAVMLYSGATVNMVSMFAFVLALGIVVDDAIVVGENIYKHRQRGDSYAQAAISGTVEVAPSVIASVTTTIIAFVPLLYVSGVLGKFIAVMPLAVISMLVISILESMTMLPCHLAHSRPTQAAWNRRFRSAIERGINGIIDGGYLPVLRWSLANPAKMLATAVSCLFLAAGLIAGGFTPFVVFPKLDTDFVRAVVVYPSGTPASVTDRATRQLEATARAVAQEYADAGTPILSLTYRGVGHVSGDGPVASQTGSHVGQVSLELLPADERNVPSSEILARWRQHAPEFPGTEALSFAGIVFGPGGQPIEFKLLGDDMEELEAAVEKAKERLASYPGVFDITDDSRPGKWELQLKVKPEAEAMGIHLADLAQTVRATYYGDEVMRLQRGRHEVKLMVRYPDNERRSLANFDEIRVRTPAGEEIPLSVLAQVDVIRGYSEIHRVNQQRSITITADLDEELANARQIVVDLQSGFMPELLKDHPSVSVRWEGQQERTNESVRSLNIGFAVALFGMLVLLTAQFRSYLQPLIVMAIIPFGLIGAVLGHLLLGLPLTLFSLFGVVALTGVVINDSIVLIDFINLRYTTGVPVQDALLDAGRERFRPVLLTSLTTVAGLLPILTETSLQAQALIPMAVSLSFGIMLSTLWVLVLVPTLFSVYARCLARGGRPGEDAETRGRGDAEMGERRVVVDGGPSADVCS